MGYVERPLPQRNDNKSYDPLGYVTSPLRPRRSFLLPANQAEAAQHVQVRINLQDMEPVRPVSQLDCSNLVQTILSLLDSEETMDTIALLEVLFVLLTLLQSGHSKVHDS